MIIVMPYGNVRPKPMPDFISDVINDVIPFVEKQLSVLTDSKNRAIAGFSVRRRTNTQYWFDKYR